MVLTIMPEFQWEPFPGASYYAINVHRVTGNPTSPENIQPIPKIEFSKIADKIWDDCAHPGSSWCLKWPNATDFTSGFSLAKGGYAYNIVAYSSNSSILATSDYEYFQIPSLGKEWSIYRTIPNCNSKGCEHQENPYWNGYDDLFYLWSDYYDLKPSMLKAIMIAETAKDGAEIDVPKPREVLTDPKIDMNTLERDYFAPNYAYGYEGGWDWNKHYDYLDNEGLYYIYPTYPGTNEPLDVLFFH
jgi:hypothetical protein